MQEISLEQDYTQKQLLNKFKFKCKKGCDLCCRDNKATLYPFDIMELCNAKNISSKEFHAKYAKYIFDTNSNILRCYLQSTPICKFYEKSSGFGCTVYHNRPARCRVYPLVRLFNPDGSINYYLPKGDAQCPGFFDTGQKQTIEEWLEVSGLNEKDSLIIDWNNFINKLKDRTDLPLDDDFFLMFFRKIFYEFDEELIRVTFPDEVVEKEDYKKRMDQLYRLADILLENIDTWKEGYNKFVEVEGLENKYEEKNETKKEDSFVNMKEIKD